MTTEQFNSMFREPMDFSNDTCCISRLLHPDKDTAAKAFTEFYGGGDDDLVTADELEYGFVRFGPAPEDMSGYGSAQKGEECWHHCRESAPGAFPVWVYEF